MFSTCLYISNEQSAVLMPLTELTWLEVRDQDETLPEKNNKKKKKSFKSVTSLLSKRSLLIILLLCKFFNH